MSHVKRKLIECFDKFEVYHFDGSLKHFQEMVSDMIERYGEDAIFSAEVEGCWDYQEYYFEVKYERFETEKEAEKRVSKKRKIREQKRKQKHEVEERERKELERLLKKYGDS